MPANTSPGTHSTTGKLPAMENREFSELKERVKLYFHCAYAALQSMSEHCTDEWGYALFDVSGALLRLYGKPTFLQRCDTQGIRRGTLWAGDGRNAVAQGLRSGQPAHSHSGVHTAAQLRGADVYFYPITLDAESIGNEFYANSSAEIRRQSIDEAPDHCIGLYGGVAILCFGGGKSMLPTVLEATAREINLQLYWYNVSCRDMIDSIGFVSINQRGGQNQIMMLSSGAYSILNLPMNDFHMRPLKKIVDPLPKNKEFWEIVTQRKLVSGYPLTLTRGQHSVYVKVRTRRSVEAKFHMNEVVVWIQKLEDPQKNAALMGGNVAQNTFKDILAESPAYRQVLDHAHISALTESNILLLGESGTGKDMVAQAVHNQSNRHTYPFVVVNCASFSKELIASELFGYEPGAFTGASKAGAIGKFQLADQGTLFLDEIGDMPLDLQANLLRAIEQKSFMRVGGNKTIHVQVRIIAATNKSLRQRVEQGLFREDLYYRLGVVRITIPPLRQRREDILPLARHFLGLIQLRFSRPSIALAQDAQNFFMQYDWPGNVRELRNLLEGIASIYNVPVIEYSHIKSYLGLDVAPALPPLAAPHEGAAGEEGATARRLVTRPAADRHAIEMALMENGHNCTRAAAALGISRRTLYRRLEQYGLMR